MISKQSILSSQQIPEWIREEYPQFVAFVEAYYEYVEQNSMVHDLHSSKDLDNTMDLFIDAFKRDFMSNIPDMKNLDTREFLRNAKAFYTSKGSDASFRFLFRAMFGKEVSIYYPETDMLRVSDGRWFQEHSIFVDVTQGNVFSVVGNKIELNGILRIVNRAKKISGTIYELFYNNTGPITGFNYGDYVSNAGLVKTFTGVVLSVYGQSDVIHGGTGFQVGQIFNIDSYNKLRVIKVSATGAIQVIKPVTYYYGVTPGITSIQLSALSNSPVSGVNAAYADINLTAGPIAIYPGYYTASNGFLSDSVRIQDSFYYQIYSYVLKIDEQLKNYKALVKSLIHPAGMELFGEYMMTSEYDMGAAVDLMDKAVKLTPLDTFIVSDITLINFVKNLVDSVTMIDNKYINVGKVLSDSVTMSDSGSIYRITPGNYDNYPTEQYFNPPEYYSQATQTLLYSW